MNRQNWEGWGMNRLPVDREGHGDEQAACGQAGTGDEHTVLTQPDSTQNIILTRMFCQHFRPS